MKESRYNVWVERDGLAYVYNGVSGGVLAMRHADYDALKRFLAGENVACPPELLVELARGRMVITDEFDELQFLSRRYQASRSDTSKFGLTIVTSLGCNFDCPYCFEAKHPSIIEPDVQEAVLQVLDDQLARINGFSVTWYGGEPLVGKKPLLALSDEFIRRCECAGVEYDADIITNGSLLTEATCADLRSRKVTHAQITLDGPPDVHDRMRPYASGRGTFWTVVGNLHHACDYLTVSIRVNLDMTNFDRVEELCQILVAEGLAGRVLVSPGQIIGMTSNPNAPSASYGRKQCCFTNREFAKVEQDFVDLATRYGLGKRRLPRPVGAPCTAVRSNELIVGSKGELYKCWDSVGDRREVIGHIRDYKNTNGRLHKWTNYDPFANDECRGCIALPVCMGGCAHHAMEALNYENRCGTFRHNYREKVLAFVASTSGHAASHH